MALKMSCSPALPAMAASMCPSHGRKLSADELRGLRGAPYHDVAYHVVSKFTGSAIPEAELKQMIAEAYATFGHPAVTPLKQIDANQWLLELFHGPTLAFKDVAMQLLARLMDWSLKKRGQPRNHCRRHLGRHRRCRH